MPEVREWGSSPSGVAALESGAVSLVLTLTRLGELSAADRQAWCQQQAQLWQQRLDFMDDAALLQLGARALDQVLGSWVLHRSLRFDGLSRDYLQATFAVILQAIQQRGYALRYLSTIRYHAEADALEQALCRQRELVEWLGLGFVSPQRVALMTQPAVLSTDSLRLDLDWWRWQRTLAYGQAAELVQKQASAGAHVFYADIFGDGPPAVLQQVFRECRRGAAVVAVRTQRDPLHAGQGLDVYLPAALITH